MTLATATRPSWRAPVVAAAAAFAAAVLWRFLTFSGFSNDHYVQVARGYQWLRGAWPVRDFVDPGMPATYALSALGRLAFGNQLRSEFVVMVLGFGAGAAATAWAAWRLAPSALIVAVVLALEILVSPRTYSYPKILLYGIAGVAVVALAASPTRRRVALCGVLIAAAFLVRHDHGLYIGLGCAAAVALRSGPVPVRLRGLALIAAVTAACLAPWAIAVQAAQGLAPYFHAGIEFSRREAEVSALRAWPAWSGIAWPLPVPSASAILYYVAYALPIVCAAIAWRRAVRGTAAWPGESAAVGGLALMALAVDRGFLRDPLAARLPDVIVPAALLGAWALGLAWHVPSRTIAGASAGAALLGLVTVSAWRVGDVHSHLDDAGVFDGWRAIVSNGHDVAAELRRPQVDVERTPTRVSAALVPFFRYVARCTSDSDRLLVTGAYADVFIAADRGFAGGVVSYQEGFYASEADQRETIARLEREPVPFAVRIGVAEPIFTRGFPLVASYVDARFAPLGEVALPQEEGVRLLVDRRRPARGTDPSTGWPCFR